MFCKFCGEVVELQERGLEARDESFEHILSDKGTCKDQLLKEQQPDKRHVIEIARNLGHHF